jgi:hypothetical protein
MEFPSKKIRGESDFNGWKGKNIKFVFGLGRNFGFYKGEPEKSVPIPSPR